MSGKKKDCTAGLKAEIAVLNRQVWILGFLARERDCDVCPAARHCSKSGVTCPETLLKFTRKQAEDEVATPNPVPNSLSAKEKRQALDGAKRDESNTPTPKSLSAKDFNNLSAWEKWQNWKGQKGIWKCKSCKAVMEDGPRSPGACEGSAIVCGECDFELTRRTPGGQSNPFEWVLS